MAAPPPNLLAEGRILVPDYGTPLSISPDASEPQAFFAAYASVQQKNFYGAGVLGHYFYFGEDVYECEGVPQLCQFKAIGDAAIIYLKLSNLGMTHLVGISIAKLIEFNDKPPAQDSGVP